MSNFTQAPASQVQEGWQPSAQQPTATPGVVPVKAVLKWAMLTKVNAMSQKYQVDLTELSDEAVQKLDEIGIKARKKDDSGWMVTAKSSRPIEAVDTNGNPITEILGNGSMAIVKLSAYDWTYQGKSGKSPSIVELKVTELLPYEKSGGGTVEDPF